MKKVVLAASLIAATPFAVAADLSYTYIEAGYTRLDYSDWAGQPDGGYVRGSFDVGAGINLIGRYSRVSDDVRIGAWSSALGSSPGWRYSFEERYMEIGLGYHRSLTDRMDLVAEVVGARFDYEAETADYHLDGARGSVGIRATMTDTLEGTVKVNRYDGGSYGYFDGATSGSLALHYRLAPAWGIAAEVEHGGFVFDEDQTQYMLGVRASF